MLVEKGRTTARNVIQHVMTHQPTDHLAQGAALKFEADPKATTISVAYTESRNGANTVLNANPQKSAGITGPQQRSAAEVHRQPRGHRCTLGRELLAHNLNTVFTNRAPKARYLLRSLGGELRGFLSDRNRQLDSRPIIEAFASAVQGKGALPYDGYVTDTKMRSRPSRRKSTNRSRERWLRTGSVSRTPTSATELCRYGLTSYESGARIWRSRKNRCGRFTLASAWTIPCFIPIAPYELDVKTTVSALRDVIDGQLDANSRKHRMATIRRANEQSVDPRSAKEAFRRLLQKGESDAATQAF